ncbi:MAG: gamma-glutamyl-gamma-aminobutyrate hydrolase family protein [Chloroflexi bacterium]|nr:gamma-glutamyl-gamma-aminobutyrate hydrolase family protein [Chloroflexota bacterium]
MAPPVIGITTVRIHGQMDGRLRDGLSQEYARAIVQAGGVPLLIPLSTIETENLEILRAAYERVDGLMIPGGGDVHPEYYGEAVTTHERGISRLRDQVELQLVRWAYEDDRPLLGICRGHQVVNVALGGTLIHDLPTYLAGKSTIQHDRDGHAGRDILIHPVDLSPASCLTKVFGKACVSVNSLHHQAVNQLASDLTATGYAPDGILEAFELVGARYFIGVQWHPEAIVTNVPEMSTLFKSFVDAC